MEYYIYRNGMQAGPFPADRLMAEGLTPETPVWREGMEDWQKAALLPELSHIFQPEESAFGSYARDPRDYAGGPKYAPGQPLPPAPSPMPFTNWLPLAIVGTVLGTCSCLGLIFGILGIVQANKANALHSAGRDTEARLANSSAKTWSIVSLVIGGLSLLGAVVSYIAFLPHALANI